MRHILSALFLMACSSEESTTYYYPQPAPFVPITLGGSAGTLANPSSGGAAGVPTSFGGQAWGSGGSGSETTSTGGLGGFAEGGSGGKSGEAGAPTVPVPTSGGTNTQETGGSGGFLSTGGKLPDGGTGGSVCVAANPCGDRVCGSVTDSCGKVWQCGTCEVKQQCLRGAECVDSRPFCDAIGVCACRPFTCSDFPKTQSGAHPNGCGGVLSCGICLYCTP